MFHECHAPHQMRFGLIALLAMLLGSFGQAQTPTGMDRAIALVTEAR